MNNIYMSFDFTVDAIDRSFFYHKVQLQKGLVMKSCDMSLIIKLLPVNELYMILRGMH